MNIEDLSLELSQVQLQDEQTLEQFRIRFLGSKNVLKDLYAAIKETSGLKCAPPRSPKIVISKYKIAAVLTELINNCTPVSEESFCAMIPEPTTVMTNTAVPKISEPKMRNFMP